MVRFHHIWHKCWGHTQLLGHFRPIWYLASAAFDRHTGPTVPSFSRLRRWRYSPMTSSSAKTSAAPDKFFTAGLTEADPDIAAAIRGELGRQRHEIELIASENIVSRAVLE